MGDACHKIICGPGRLGETFGLERNWRVWAGNMTILHHFKPDHTIPKLDEHDLEKWLNYSKLCSFIFGLDHANDLTVFCNLVCFYVHPIGE